MYEYDSSACLAYYHETPYDMLSYMFGLKNTYVAAIFILILLLVFEDFINIIIQQIKTYYYRL